MGGAVMLASLVALSVGAASAASDGCDAPCAHRGLELSCRVRIDWAMTHTTFRDHPASACDLSRAHVLELCPRCASCTKEALGVACTQPTNSSSDRSADGALQNASASGSSVGNASVNNLRGVNASQHLGNTSEGKVLRRGHANASQHLGNTSKGKAHRHGHRAMSRTTTTRTTSTTGSMTSDTFCCSAAVDDDNFCGTCWENAPMMDETRCRKSQETCEECGHVWCNRSTIVVASCKMYGCIPFTPFNECQCNPECVRFGSCCDDYTDKCVEVKQAPQDTAAAPAFSKMHAVPGAGSGGLVRRKAGARVALAHVALASASGLAVVVAIAARRGWQQWAGPPRGSVVLPEEPCAASEGDASAALVGAQ